MADKIDLESGNKSKKRELDHDHNSALLPPVKKKRLLDIEPNPYGIQPWGNYYMSSMGPYGIRLNRKEIGLGYMSVLEDQQLLEQILVLMTAEDLRILAQVSKALYIFSHYDDLWRELTLDYYGGSWTFRNTWKTTYNDCDLSRLNSENPTKKHQFPPHIPLSVDFFYSDLLYDEYQSASVDLTHWSGLCIDNIDRRSNLTCEEFDSEYGFPNKPVIISDLVPTWPAWHKWKKELLIERFKGKTFQIGRVETTLDKYFEYCQQSKEEKPLYLFDNMYGEKYPDLLDDYSVPPYFRTDYFELLPPKERPSYRWMLMGPPRSGSTFHKDPNSTSAWNGLISGLKMWIMYPPDVPPPAVYPSKDEADVTTPVSVTEWMLRFYKEIRNGPVKPIQCLQRPGDLIFIPNGWWHQVLNIEECIAVTQNVVCDANLTNVVKFLKAKKRPDVWNEFSKVMREKYPEKLEKAEMESKSHHFEIEAPEPCAQLEKGGSFWKPNNFSFASMFANKEKDNGQE